VPEPFESYLDHVFQDRALCEQALTHRSLGIPHNERLEFLGDAVLGWAVAEGLYRRFGEWDEGRLTRARAALVSQSVLAELATEIGLEGALRVGAGALSGPAARQRALASALEAVIGAIACEAGPEAARVAVEQLLAHRWSAAGRQADRKDPKTRLQELLQGSGLPPPGYVLQSATGPGHHRLFTVRCEVPARELAEQGQGSSMRLAEQAAAAALLARIGHD
jgi:ribonuclease-3